MSGIVADLHRPCQQQGAKKLSRPRVTAKVEQATREHPRAGYGILKVAAMVGVGSGSVQRVKSEMVREEVEAATVMRLAFP